MKKFLRILLASFTGSLIALLIAVFLFFSLLGSMLTVSSEKTPVIPTSAVLRINFEQMIGEQSTEDLMVEINPFSNTPSKTIGILSVLQSIDKAAEDPAIKFLYLDVTNLNCGITHLEEIRDALERFRQSGKAVIAYADNFALANYYLATAADKIYMDPSGNCMIVGLSIDMLFFKDLLDKLGVEMELIRYGKYKAAAEQFVNSKISIENREQNQVMIDAMWNSFIEPICQSREISKDEFNRLVDNLELLSPQDLIGKKMIDGVKYRDEMESYLCEMFGVKESKDLKMVSLANYHKAKVVPNLKVKDKIAVLYANGDIVDGSSDKNIAGDTFANHISTIRKDSTIKALVLRVNSPGGSAQASEKIKRELDLTKEVKPVIVSYGDYAASGGYWISNNGSKIFTNNNTLTGSIGVFSMIPVYGKGLKQHLKINVETIKSNEHGDMGNGMRPLHASERAYIQRFTDQTYFDFLERVSQGRNMTVEQVDKIGQGRVWSGRDALEIGLVDTKGGLIDAINYAASLKELDSYRIVEYPVQKSSVERLMESLTNASSTVSSLANPLELFENTYSTFGSDDNLKVMARLPYLYLWK